MIISGVVFAMSSFPSHVIALNYICRPGDESPAKDHVISCGGNTGGTSFRSRNVSDNICPQHGA
jgi:hypothetical protein